MPRRASWAARIVPEAPPPTIATAVWRSDFVVRPILRVRRAGFARLDMVVDARHRLARGLREATRNDRVDDRGATRADQLGADLHRADAVPRPAHAERARMLTEQAVGQSRAILGPLLRSHPSTLAFWRP